MEFAIRPAESQDDLLNYCRACFPLFKEKFYSGSIDSDEDLFKKHCEDLSAVDFFGADVTLFVAQDDEGVFSGAVWVGLREENDVWDKTGERVAWVSDVEVLPEFRGHGLGRQLMLRAEEWARINEFGRIGLHTDYTLDVARNLYLNLGYKDFAYILRKSVSKPVVRADVEYVPSPLQSKELLDTYYDWRRRSFSSIVGISKDAEGSVIESLYPKFRLRPNIMDSEYATYVICSDSSLLGLVFGKVHQGAAWLLDLEMNRDFDWTCVAYPLLHQMEIWAESQGLDIMAIFLHAKRTELIQILQDTGYKFTNFLMHKYLQ